VTTPGSDGFVGDGFEGPQMARGDEEREGENLANDVDARRPSGNVAGYALTAIENVGSRRRREPAAGGSCARARTARGSTFSSAIVRAGSRLARI